MEGESNNNNSMLMATPYNPPPYQHMVRGSKAPRSYSAAAFIDDECEVDEPSAVRAQDLEDDCDQVDMDDDPDEVDEDQPDVLGYLDRWEIPFVDKVSILRTAANYLTSLAKNQNPELKGRRLK